LKKPTGKQKRKQFGFILYKTAEGLQNAMDHGEQHLINGRELICKISLTKDELHSLKQEKKQNETSLENSSNKNNTLSSKQDPDSQQILIDDAYQREGPNRRQSDIQPHVIFEFQRERQLTPEKHSIGWDNTEGKGDVEGRLRARVTNFVQHDLKQSRPKSDIESLVDDLVGFDYQQEEDECEAKIASFEKGNILSKALRRERKNRTFELFDSNDCPPPEKNGISQPCTRIMNSEEHIQNKPLVDIEEEKEYALLDESPIKDGYRFLTFETLSQNAGRYTMQKGGCPSYIESYAESAPGFNHHREYLEQDDRPEDSCQVAQSRGRSDQTSLKMMIKSEGDGDDSSLLNTANGNQFNSKSISRSDLRSVICSDKNPKKRDKFATEGLQETANTEIRLTNAQNLQFTNYYGTKGPLILMHTHSNSRVGEIDISQYKEIQRSSNFDVGMFTEE